MPSKNKISKFTGAWIATKRKNLGISQEYIASQMLKSQSYWSKIESGSRSISLDEFDEICKILGMDPLTAASEIYYQAIGRLI